MNKDRKPGFLRRLFGSGAAKPKAGELSPEAIARKGAEKASPRAKPEKTSSNVIADAREQKVEPANAAAPPPAGPAAPPGVRSPDERRPGTRKKGTPKDTTGARKRRRKGAKPGGSAESDKADLLLRSAPPPHAPHSIPANKPEEREEARSTALTSKRNEPTKIS